MTALCSPGSGGTFPVMTTTVTCTATDARGNASRGTFTVTVRDTTRPTVTFSGNATPYTVDQIVHISCLASDAVGVVSSTGCGPIDGPAYAFGLGSHTITATATDAAGNTGTASVTFEVRATAASLCALGESFSTKPGVARSLCAKLQNAAAALARGDTKTHDNELRAYRSEVSAQSGKALTEADAATLTDLASHL